ncbi:MAG: extracellular solute-binding protein [Treponema sp.]|jgi:iron(III) transport system substrate-binding protein|nr:extracellular solute-binding protein [Treponema sp.]
MKKINLLIIGLLSLLVLSCQTSAARQEQVRIVIYTSMYTDVIENVKRDLNNRFPAWQIEFVYSGTGVIQQWIEADSASGRLKCDIVMIADPAYSLELKEKNMLHPFKSKEASALAFDYDIQGYWYPVRVSNMVLAFNPARHARNTVPNSFADFANDAGARGAISMRNPLVSGTTMATATALRDKYGYAYFEALGRQRVMIDYGNDQTLRKLENGESRVAMILEESILKIRQERNSSLEVIYPTDGVVVIPSNIMIINNHWSANKNVKAAEEITEWFLSTEGQTAIVNGWMHSVRKDFHLIPYNSIPINEIRENSIPVIWENVFRQRQEIRQRFEEYITRGR